MRRYCYGLLHLAFILLLAISEPMLLADSLRGISSREGISNNSILSLAQDDDGYLWFGTCDGLDVWNGYSAELYPTNATGMVPLSGNLIEEILPTIDSHFWICTNYGLNLFGREGVIETHSAISGMYKAAVRGWREVIVITKSDELFGYRSSDHTFLRIHKPENLRYSNILDMVISEDGNVWFFCTDGMFYAPLIVPEDDYPVCIGPMKAVDTEKNFQFAFKDCPNNVFVVDGSGKLYMFCTAEHTMEFVADIRLDLEEHGPISDILCSDGNVYIAYLYNGVTCISSDGDFSRLGVDCGVFDLLQDCRQEILWIATDGQGVKMYVRGEYIFDSYTFDRLPFGLSKPIRAILCDENDNLWLATKGEGIVKISDFHSNVSDPMTWKAQQMTIRNSGLTSDTVYAFEQSERGIVWIGHEGVGLDYWSPIDRKIHSLGGDIPEDLKYIHSIYESNENELWVTSVGCGVFKLKISGDAFPCLEAVELMDFGNEMKYKNFYFTMKPEENGNFFFGNRGGGLVHYDPESRRSFVYTFDNGRPLTANDVWTIHRASNGQLWVGTTCGLLKVNERDYTAEDTPLKGTVHGIVEDADGILWVATNKGLIRYMPYSGSSLAYGYSYGVDVIEFSDGGEYYDELRNEMYFGGINGFVTVRKGRIRDVRPYNPELLLCDVKISGSVFLMSERVKHGILKIKPNETLESIRLNALDNINGSNYVFYYSFKPRRGEWIQTGHEIQFTDLPSGKHKLSVKYFNPVTDYTSPFVTVEIIIMAPWYRSALATILYFLAAIGLIAWVTIVYRKRRQVERKAREEKMDAQRKEEILDSRVRLFEGILQEMSQPLAMISGPGQQVIDYEKSDYYIRSRVEKMLRQSGKLVDTLRIFQDFIVSSDSSQVSVQMFSVSALTRDIASFYMTYATRSGIKFLTDIGSQIVWQTSSRGMVMITHMLLSNAFRYAADATVSLIVSAKEPLLSIEVKVSDRKFSIEEQSALKDVYDSAVNYTMSSTEGQSFRDEMRFAICSNLAGRLSGRIVPAFSSNEISFTVELPPLTSETLSLDAASGYPEEEHGAVLDLGTESETFSTFKPVRGRPLIFIIGTNAGIMNFIAEAFSAEFNIKMLINPTEAEKALKFELPVVAICENIATQKTVFSVMSMIKQCKRTSHIPIILITAIRQLDDRSAAVEYGADVCVSLPFNVKYIRTLVKQMIHRQESLKDYYRSTVSAYNFVGDRVLHDEDKAFVDKMLGVINENIADTELDTSFVAKEMGMSLRALYNRVEPLMDVRPVDIIKEYRLSFAEQLLSTTKMNIDEILCRSGYINRGTFYKNFFNKYGMTPKNYRKLKIEESRQSLH